MHISEDTLDYHKNKLKLFKKEVLLYLLIILKLCLFKRWIFTSNVMRVIHNENLKRGSHIFIMESLKN